MSADLINGLYEGLGAFFILGHCWNLWKSKQPWGVSILAIIFFTSWGVWNLYYYPSLGQWYSFSGGVLIVLCNFLYVSLLVYLRKKHPKPTRSKEEILEHDFMINRKRRPLADGLIVFCKGMVIRK